MTRSLAVIVPLYNDVGNVAPFLERMRPVLAALPGLDPRIVFVNNGSADGSYERVDEARRADDRIKVITLSRNFGYHAALLSGLSLVNAELYVMIDVDCEDP